ncbi:MAG: hypothetical protein WD314_16535 [Trueperaceae bacterium]
MATANAHGFGQRYDLPVPLSLYLIGAGAAVVLSFVVAAVFLRTGSAEGSYPRLNLLRWRAGRALFSRQVGITLELLSVSVFLLVLVAGLIGTTNQVRNIAPVLVWVIWWVGIAYFSALAGNIWHLTNPWRILFSWAEALARRFDPEASLSMDLPYPRRLGVWPGVILFFAFAWLEIAFHDPARPSNIATMALVYSVITWSGMIVFGKDRWLYRGEVFTLVFGLLARFAPTEARTIGDACSDCPSCGSTPADSGLASSRPAGAGPSDCVNCYSCFEKAPPERRQINLRPFAVGLQRTDAVSLSMMAFVVLLLATVTFDGFTDTPTWASIVVGYYSTFGQLTGIATLGLLAFPLLFMALYLVTSAMMPLATGRRLPLLETAKPFVLSLVPIALAYHLAHYLTYLLTQGQLLVPLISDPFGFGWDLFGTADYSIDLNIVGARFAWYTAVTAIVVGHMVAVWLAHLTALRVFGNERAALRSQYPMLALMVGYTAISLWILAQPIVEAGIPG